MAFAVVLIQVYSVSDLLKCLQIDFFYLSICVYLDSDVQCLYQVE